MPEAHDPPPEPDPQAPWYDVGDPLWITDEDLEQYFAAISRALADAADPQS